MGSSYQIYALNDGGVNPMMVNELSTYGDLHVGGDLYVDGDIIGGGGNTSVIWTPDSATAWVPLTDQQGNIQLLESDVYHNPTMMYAKEMGAQPAILSNGTNRIFFKKSDGSDTCYLDIAGVDTKLFNVAMYHGQDDTNPFYFVQNDYVTATSWTFPDGDWKWDSADTVISDKTPSGLVFYPFTLPVTPKPTVVKFTDLLPPTSLPPAVEYDLTAAITDRLELSFKWARPSQ
jgi:hypothetical protein